MRTRVTINIYNIEYIIICIYKTLKQLLEAKHWTTNILKRKVMPCYKPVDTLKKLCIRRFFGVVYAGCRRKAVEGSHSPAHDLFIYNSDIEEGRYYILNHLPATLLDEVIFFHSTTTAMLNWHERDTQIEMYFYDMLLHDNMRSIRLRNFNVSLNCWVSMFEKFHNLVNLNLAKSCTDEILKLIPQYCPNLEKLNATCKYERIVSGGNAAAFKLAVTDCGLGYLCHCDKLRDLTINEPRGTNGITYEGMRNLLLHIKTLENISYADLGSVICQGLEHLDSLNLRTVRHYNASVSSIWEILRLCKHLESLYLVFFNESNAASVFEVITGSRVQLQTLEVRNYSFGPGVSNVFEKIGSSLVCLRLHITTSMQISFDNLEVIGRFCPNIEYLGISMKASHSHRPLTNFNQFPRLVSLRIAGPNVDIEKVLMFCTVNATNLVTLKIADCVEPQILDKLFRDKINNLELQFLYISKKYWFTRQGVTDLIDKFKKLNYLEVVCPDACHNIHVDIDDGNYDMNFVNIPPSVFQEIFDN